MDPFHFIAPIAFSLGTEDSTYAESDRRCEMERVWLAGLKTLLKAIGAKGSGLRD